MSIKFFSGGLRKRGILKKDKKNYPLISIVMVVLNNKKFLQQSINSLAILGILMSVISSFYYIRLIKVSFFKNKAKFNLIDSISKTNSYIISLSFQFIVFFFLITDLLLTYLQKVTLLFIL